MLSEFIFILCYACKGCWLTGLLLALRLWECCLPQSKESTYIKFWLILTSTNICVVLSLPHGLVPTAGTMEFCKTVQAYCTIQAQRQVSACWKPLISCICYASCFQVHQFDQNPMLVPRTLVKKKLVLLPSSSFEWGGGCGLPTEFFLILKNL